MTQICWVTHLPHFLPDACVDPTHGWAIPPGRQAVHAHEGCDVSGSWRAFSGTGLFATTYLSRHSSDGVAIPDGGRDLLKARDRSASSLILLLRLPRSDGQNDLAEEIAAFHRSQTLGSIGERQHTVDDGTHA